MTGQELAIAIFRVCAWPLTGVVGFALFILVFRRAIRDWIGRWREVSRKGIRSAPDQPQMSAEPQSTSADKLRDLFDSKTLRDREDAIRKDLESRGVVDVAEKEKALVRSLALTQLALSFQLIYSLIYGSQIAILKSLNTARLGVSRDKVKEIYDFAASRHPDTYKNYAYERYLAFLADSGLIAEEGGLVFVTPLGVEFLQFLARTGKPEFKPL